ncbi:hypothetical protein SEA_REINDEER_123 [Mycobacterium phage Reindeer]|uniref:Uncharacterized protein n=1 Tax=Mycobacterium phage Reindeer TaxID=2762283 RepID=A0A7G8LI42_9CAUD|nr:hypothetical protein J4U05_gp129 [Mycobacterium phage Reindeer]QNJ56914.1 hypothetical protein SEA_REINDEER_123 [Mycobacterium phage Reindeer]
MTLRDRIDQECGLGGLVIDESDLYGRHSMRVATEELNRAEDD